MNEKKSKEINFGNILEIKHPLIHIGSDESYSLWFEDYNGNIVAFSDIPGNYPRWAICTQTKDEMIQEAKRLVQHGKELLEVDPELEHHFEGFK